MLRPSSCFLSGVLDSAEFKLLLMSYVPSGQPQELEFAESNPVKLQRPLYSLRSHEVCMVVVFHHTLTEACGLADGAAHKKLERCIVGQATKFRQFIMTHHNQTNLIRSAFNNYTLLRPPQQTDAIVPGL